MAIAVRPATPAPRMSTVAGRIVPAAVVSIGRNLGQLYAPRIAAAYPPAVAWELSASMLWARVIRGTSSRAKAVTSRSRIRATVERLFAAFMNPMTIVLAESISTSAMARGCTHNTIVAPSSSSARPGAIFAPAAT